jgi:hypothetical protein
MSMFGQRPPSGRPAPEQANGPAVGALVCGVIGIFLLQIILGPIAIILGFLGLNRANRGARHRGLAMAGIILGAIAVILFILAMVSQRHNQFDWHTRY